MPYAFQPGDPTLRAALRRLAAEQAGRAITALDDTGQPRSIRVHEARKAIKRLRALLRLVRPGLRDFKPENATLRDIARTLAPLRDADVTGELLVELAAQAGLPVPKDEMQAAPLPPDEAKARVRAAVKGLTALQHRSKAWKPEGRGFDALAVGLARSWDDGRQSLRQAEKQGTPEAIHELRKRIKDHWYHARLLVPIWPQAMGLHRNVAGALGETLGLHQDLAVLEDRLGARPALRPILDLARQRRGEILAEALPQAARLYAEPGKVVARRWAAWWQLSGLTEG